MNAAQLVRLVDRLEEHADPYLTLEQVAVAAGVDVAWAVAEALLLVDYRRRPDGTTVILCRLNRRDPRVAELTRW